MSLIMLKKLFFSFVLLNILGMDPVLTTEKDTTLSFKELLVTQRWQKNTQVIVQFRP